MIGCGGIADRRMIPEGIVPPEKCHLAVVMDTSPEWVRAVAEKYRVKGCYTDVTSLLQVAEIQAVYIASSNNFHKEKVIAAARAGKHVLVEKSIALCAAAFSRILTHAYLVDDSTTVLCEFESGAQGVVEVNINAPDDDAAQNSLEVRSTRGVVVADHTIGQAAGAHCATWNMNYSHRHVEGSRTKH